MKETQGPGRLALAAILAFVVTLAATAPAHLAVSFIASPQISMQGVEGTVWSGRSRMLVVEGKGIGELGWRINPLGWLPGGMPIEWRLRTQGGEIGGGLRPAGERQLLTAVTGRLPASALQSHLPVPAVLGGVFVLDFERAVLVGGRPEAIEGTIRWNGAAVGLGQALHIGDLRASLRPSDKGGLVADLEDLGGPLELQGSATLSGGTHAVDLRLRARPSADSALRDSLGLLGNPDRAGWYRLRYGGA